MRVAMTFVSSPKKSTRHAAQELSLLRTSLRRLMRKLNLKPYRPRLLHGLLEDNVDRRLRFCDIYYIVYTYFWHTLYLGKCISFTNTEKDAIPKVLSVMLSKIQVF